MESDEIGVPPMAYTSLNEFTAAIAPNVYASSTIGVKKSTVWTRAHSGVSLYTPASSDVSNPISTLLFGQRGMRWSTWSKTFGLSLDAQPAARTLAVNLAVIMYPRQLPGYEMTRLQRA